MIRSYRDLLAWQQAMQLVEVVYDIASLLPVEERFCLSQQLRRAVVSIPSNLAEGHAQGATRNFIRYIAMAQGSLAEVETQLELINRLRMIESNQVNDVFARCDELGRMLRGLRKALDKKLDAIR